MTRYLLLALLISGAVQAQTPITRVTPCNAATPNDAICLAWTTGNNTGVTSPITYRVEQKSGSGAYATVAPALSVLQYYATGLAPGPYTFRVFANSAGYVESNPSNESTKDATKPSSQLNPPVLIIAATIRAGQPPVYRVVYTVKPRDGELVFVAPESMRSAFGK